MKCINSRKKKKKRKRIEIGNETILVNIQFQFGELNGFGCFVHD